MKVSAISEITSARDLVNPLMTFSASLSPSFKSLTTPSEVIEFPVLYSYIDDMAEPETTSSSVMNLLGLSSIK